MAQSGACQGGGFLSPAARTAFSKMLREGSQPRVHPGAAHLEGRLPTVKNTRPARLVTAARASREVRAQQGRGRFPSARSRPGRRQMLYKFRERRGRPQLRKAAFSLHLVRRQALEMWGQYSVLQRS